MSKVMLNDENSKNITGGFLQFDEPAMTLKYTHVETGDVTYYTVLDFDKAWKLNNLLHAQNRREDNIIKALLDNGYIE